LLSAQTSREDRPDAQQEAARALAEGRPYRATRLLAPLLAVGTGRDSVTVLLAARAAAGWEGWGSVLRLLAPAPWLDRYENGEGRALLARARVERAEPAVEDARKAVAVAGPDPGPRLITLARAFDRADLLDSAAATYRRAASALPAIADWLRLRATGVLADSAQRNALLRSVSLPAAVARSGWTDALARDRTGDPRGAARIYDSLGASVAALRLRLRAIQAEGGDSTERAAVRRAVTALLGTRLGAEDSRDAIELLDDAFAPLGREEEILVARRAAATDRLPRAVLGYSRAARLRALSESDRLGQGTALARLGRHREAMALFATIRSRDLTPEAQYLRARSLLAVGRRPEAIATLRQVARSYRYDSVTAAMAGYLAGDLLVDDHNDARAREAYLEVARRFPRTGHGARAAFQAALLAYVQGSPRVAAQEFTALSERASDRTEGIAALYWSGRALLAVGDTVAARARWRAVLDRFPSSYYVLPAAKRLGVLPIGGQPTTPFRAPDSDVLAALDRAALLDNLGLRVEARFEYDRVSREAAAAPARVLAVSNAYLERGLVGRAYRLASRITDGGGLRLAFPLPRPWAAFAEDARQAGLDPLLVSAIIRQESAFDPGARSVADARGLMQVVPILGASLARAEGLADWDASLLYQPEINLRFGFTHLAEALKRYPRLEAALAAYNAGTRPADRWLALPGAALDPEVYIERIQFVETRDYVRRILRNLAVYRALYPAVP